MLFLLVFLSLYQGSTSEITLHFLHVLGFTPGCNSLADAIADNSDPQKYLHLIKIER